MFRTFAGWICCAAALAAQTQEYSFGFLQSPPDRVTLPKEEAAKLQAGHMAHLTAMAEKEALVAAGPLAGGGALRGVLIFRTPPSLDEAKAMAAQDPTVQAGQLAVELWRWTGPAAIGAEYRRRHVASGGKMAVKMVKHHLVLSPSPVTPVKGKWIAAGELRGGARHIAIHQELTAEEVRALEGPGVQVLVWYVADGVLPAPR